MAIPEVSVDDLDVLVDRKVLDVREPDEYAAGHVPGARNVPLATVREHVDALRDAGPVHVICQSGRRSAQATEALQSAGVDAVNVAGGTSAWVAAGKPVEH
ncbi:rhodanese-like domain-containing protein (plasmid) [Curtobacterium sp. C1]|jgi:rhodanese-related sulfurtransferase|uniref:rhodanese-like domain-containing protein n=1 Tax=Curtobacterium TaxID=2034 RepID=UPI001E32B314|nr:MULTISPECIES: rhodanese-like domain-containing protein [Curtobacterium]MCE0459496.1 rhodanese-like domain-containing protein [Curtobacterium allii]UFU15876.1 rhodanese-like domain-containing protein [Curtobacterium sp. C1]